MPAPSTPSLTLSALSATSFSAAVVGDAGVTNRVFYRDISKAAQPDVVSSTFSGDGSASVTGLIASGQYAVWVVADNGQFSLPAIGFVSLALPATLLAAAIAKFQGAPALTALFPGGAFANEIPETLNSAALSPPWAILENRRTRFEWVQNAIFYEVSDLHLTLFCPGAAVAETCLAAVRSVYDWDRLTFTDGYSTTSYIQPVRYEVAAEPVRYRDGTLIYTVDLDYEIWVNRTANFLT